VTVSYGIVKEVAKGIQMSAIWEEDIRNQTRQVLRHDTILNHVAVTLRLSDVYKVRDGEK